MAGAGCSSVCLQIRIQLAASLRAREVRRDVIAAACS